MVREGSRLKKEEQEKVVKIKIDKKKKTKNFLAVARGKHTST